ncbi:ricin-type beta-trefoil lectin domain protein [Kitasatospora sp. NPDC049258]|uniref:ricin-type beta-trefoil lectin domain protein n=1 Tax=Kitasatospora sp. NPDC049258 TaxID=3155394 RepID=UPI0034165897
MTTAIGLTVLSSPITMAATVDPTPTPSGSSAPAKADQQPTDSAAGKAIHEALAQAKATGKPVTIDALTTESSESVANPDGHTVTANTHAQDVRTKRDGGWKSLDTTLRTGSDGTLAPAVTSQGLTLSGGGTGPLATITTTDGKKLSVSAPFALPRPTVDGSTATYASVLPDVDLQVSALPDGGWRDVIVVRTAAAAADPRLKSLHFPVQTTGLKVANDQAGNVSVTDENGKERMHAPTPFQWDSAEVAPPAPQLKAAKAAPKSLFAAPGAIERKSATEKSTAKDPGDGATVSTMAIKATETGIDLTPDQATFGKGAGPWYLDPTVSANATRQVNAQVQENHKDTANVNTLSSLGIGYCGYSDCTGYGRYRSYYQLGIPSVLFSDGSRGTATISSATMSVPVNSAAAPGTNSPINLYNTPQLSGTTTWNNQPCGTGNMNGCDKVGTYWITGTGTMNYDVTWWMQRAADNKWANWTVGFAPDNEGEKLYRHHLGADPNIAINYDIAPTIWYPRTTPTPGYNADPVMGDAHNDCQTPGGAAWYQPGWVGANQNVYLHTSSWSPIGSGLDTTFRMWDDNDGNAGQTPHTGPIGSYNNDAVVSVGLLADGHQYGWTATVTDGWLTSGETPWCYFRVDKTPPTVAISSTDFPASGTLNVVPKKKVREAGTFTVTATDPAPINGLNASGVACTRWTTDPTPVTGWSCNDAGVIKGSTGTFNFTPTTWGTNILFAQSMDVAGNYSQPFPYTFYAPWDPVTGAAVPGDLSGDGRADLLQADGAGNLRVMPADTDPTLAQAAPLGLSPLNDTTPVGWQNVQTTHRGALRSMGVDDAFAWTGATPAMAKNLYLYQNKGDGTFKDASVLTKPTTWADPVTGAALTSAPAGWNADWSKTTQIVALGALKAPVSSGDSIASKNQTSLLTVENGNLWLYRADTTNTLDAAAVKVSGTGNWANFDLINPGTASGTAQPTLWARDRLDGTLRAYDITIKTDGSGTLDLSALADPKGSKARIIGGVPAGQFPQVGAADATKDGIADFWAIDANKHLQFWPGKTSGGTAATPVTTFATPNDQGDTRAPVDRIALSTSTGGITQDAYGKSPGTVKGGVTFGTDTVNGKATTVANFNGSDGEIGFNNLKVNTLESFSVTLWAKPNKADSVVISQDGGSGSDFLVWPSSNGDGNATWLMSMAQSAGHAWTADYEHVAKVNSAARVQFGTWTKLTISYNSKSGQMSLYVNGALAATGTHTNKLNSGGSLVLGRFRNGGAASNYYSGSIADVVVNDYSIDPGSVTGPIVSDIMKSKCLDDPNGVTDNGTPVQIYDCNGSIPQQFTAQANGSVVVKGKCLDAYGSGTTNGTKIVLFDCLGGANQVWQVRPDGSIFNPISGRCLDVPNGNAVNGNQMQLYDCNNTSAQRWFTRTVA